MEALGELVAELARDPEQSFGGGGGEGGCGFSHGLGLQEGFSGGFDVAEEHLSQAPHQRPHGRLASAECGVKP